MYSAHRFHCNERLFGLDHDLLEEVLKLDARNLGTLQTERDTMVR